MKRIVAVLLLVIMLLGLTACSSIEQPTVGEVFIKECGFHIKEALGKYGTTTVYLVYDVDTGVEYLFAFDGDRMAICPYYNSDGTVAIYNGK